jgi:hypothetical protein
MCTVLGMGSEVTYEMELWIRLYQYATITTWLTLHMGET